MSRKFTDQLTSPVVARTARSALVRGIARASEIGGDIDTVSESISVRIYRT